MAKSIARNLADVASPTGVLDGTLSTAAQTNVTSVGTLSSLTVSGNLNATLTTAAQGNITSLGTLTALTVDNLGINGNTITANSGALNLTPASGSAIVLDGTINVDAGVVTGATSITSTAFVGGLTGNVTGNASGTAATVTGAAQTNITSVGTLSALTVSGDLTVDTSTLKVDSSNNRVGIGEATPDNALHIKGSGFNAAHIKVERTDVGSSNDAALVLKAAAGANADYGLGGIWFQNALDANAYALIRGRTDDSSGTSGRLDFITSTSSVGNGTAASMTIKSDGNVGIGTSSAGTFRTKIKHSAASVTTGLGIEASANDSVLRVFHSGSLAGFNATYSSTGAYVPMVFNVGSGGEAMRIDTSGKVGIGTSAPGSLLEIRKTTAGNITGGTSNQGATLTLHHEAQWENGYTGGDFLGALNFSSGDSSTGEGVRAAIKVSVNSYYNSNKMHFYVAQSNSTTLVERMELDDELTFKGRSGTSPAIEMVNMDNEDNDTGRETTLRFKGHRSGGELITNAQISGHHFGTADDDKGGLIFWTNSGSAGLEEKMRMHEDGSITTPKRPVFVAHLAANTAYNSGVNQLNGNGWTAIHINVGSHFSTSTGKFTAPVTGMYQFTVNLATTSSASATQYWSAEIYTQASGGSALRVLGGWNEHTAGYQRTEATYTRYLTAGTTVWPAMENATNITLLGSNPGVYSRFDGFLIG